MAVLVRVQDNAKNLLPILLLDYPKTEEAIKDAHAKVHDLIKKVDMPRTTFFSDQDPLVSHEKIVEKFTQQFDQANEEGKNFYTQGGWDGRLFTVKNFRMGKSKEGFPRTVFEFLSGFIDKEGNDVEDILKKPLFNIQLGYIDDNKALCGLCIYLAEEGTKENGFLYRYGITMTKNVASLLEKQEITYIAHPDLYIPNSTKNQANLTREDVLVQVKTKLNSASLFEAIEPILLDNGLANKKAFDQLAVCTVGAINCKLLIKRLLSLSLFEKKAQFCTNLGLVEKIEVFAAYFVHYFASLTIEELSNETMIEQLGVLCHLNDLLKTEDLRDSFFKFLIDRMKTNSVQQNAVLFQALQKESFPKEAFQEAYKEYPTKLKALAQRRDESIISHKDPINEARRQQSFVERNVSNLVGLTISLLILTVAIVTTVVFASTLGIFILPAVTVVFGLVMLGSVVMALVSGKIMYDTEKEIPQYVSEQQGYKTRQQEQFEREAEQFEKALQQQFDKILEAVPASSGNLSDRSEPSIHSTPNVGSQQPSSEEDEDEASASFHPS